MCGIIGLFGGDQAGEQAKKGLELMASRGEDHAGLSDGQTYILARKPDLLSTTTLTGDCAIGHNLHAMIGHVPQPLRGKGILVANGEIYNWKELREPHHENDMTCLLSLLDQIPTLTQEYVEEVLNKLDGVYAFIYWRDEEIIIARDLLGVKPLCLSTQPYLMVASQKEILQHLGAPVVEEIMPRTILHYNKATKEVIRWMRPFFPKQELFAQDEKALTEKLVQHLRTSVQKRLPEKTQTIGVLFSGGIDSTLIAKLLLDTGANIHLYTTIVSAGSGKEAHDLSQAKNSAAWLGCPHTIITLNEKDVERYAQEITHIIDEAHAVKVAVGIPFFAAAMQARKDGCKLLFSGLGAEELFAGYHRHKTSKDINAECRSGLLQLYERDLYRDDVITMYHSLELRLPLLDKELISFSLRVKPELKITKEHDKYLLRKAAESIGLPKTIAYAKKKAAQYGSKSDQTLQRLAKHQGLSRAAYLQTFLSKKPRIGVLCSGGKDSWYAAFVMAKQHYEVVCVLTMRSNNQDSYMFHTPTISQVSLQAETAEIAFLEQETTGEKEEELKDLRMLLKKAKETHHIEGVCVGALASQYQRERVEQACDQEHLKTFSPLWQTDPHQLMERLLDLKFEIIITRVAAEGLKKELLGKRIDKEILQVLYNLESRYGVHPAGEGGEYETFVLDCPLFRAPLEVLESKMLGEGGLTWRLEATFKRGKRKT